MLDLRFVRENPEIVKENIKRSFRIRSFRSSTRSLSLTSSAAPQRARLMSCAAAATVCRSR